MKALMRELTAVGPLLPGTLVTIERPLKGAARTRRKGAGLTHMLCYNLRGRNSSMYVRPGEYQQVAAMVANYKRARELVGELALAMVATCRQEGAATAATVWAKHQAAAAESVPPPAAAASGRQWRAVRRSRDTWKLGAMARTRTIARQKVTIRDLTRSRERWRQEARKVRRQARAAAQELSRLRMALAAAAPSGETAAKKKPTPTGKTGGSQAVAIR